MANKENVVWKTYPEYPFIQANQFGEVRTLDRYVTCKNGVKRFVKGHVLKQCKIRGGYLCVSTRVNGRHINLQVHRIIASCFLPNPDNLPEVNHKDCNRTNNNVSNLEWCTRQYNITYKEKYGISAAEVLGRPVFAVNLATLKVLHFESQHEAGRQLEVDQSNITKVLKGRYKTAGNFWFCYVDENAVENTRLKFGDEVAGKVKALLDEKAEN